MIWGLIALPDCPNLMKDMMDPSGKKGCMRRRERKLKKKSEQKSDRALDWWKDFL